MMQTKEIQRSEWPTFFDVFSREHHKALINVEIFGLAIGDQVEQKKLPLEGITAELDTRAGDTVLIMAGSKPDDHITHLISHPTQISIEQTDEGANSALAIKASDGTTTLLRFHTPVLLAAIN
jgi:hypothetical protein